MNYSPTAACDVQSISELTGSAESVRIVMAEDEWQFSEACQHSWTWADRERFVRAMIDGDAIWEERRRIEHLFVSYAPPLDWLRGHVLVEAK